MESPTLDYDKVQSIDPEEVRILEEYEQLMAKLHKQKLILSVMKNINCNDIKSMDDTGKKNIDQALDFVRAYDYLKMDSSGTNVLGKFFFNQNRVSIAKCLSILHFDLSFDMDFFLVVCRYSRSTT